MYLQPNSAARIMPGGTPPLTRRRPARLGYLGKTTSTPPISLSSVAPSAAQAMQSLNIPTNDFMFNWTMQAIEQGYLPDYTVSGPEGGSKAFFTGSTQGCGKYKGSLKAAFTSVVGSTAMSVGGMLATNPLTLIPGLVTFGVGAIVSGIGSIFTHHAKAVAAEQGTLCGAVPAANAILEQLDSWLASGQVTASTVAQALDAVQSQFRQMTAPVTKGMNEGGIYNRALKGIVMRRKLDLQAAAAGAAGAGEQISLATGIPPAALIFGGLFLAYELLF